MARSEDAVRNVLRSFNRDGAAGFGTGVGHLNAGGFGRGGDAGPPLLDPGLPSQAGGGVPWGTLLIGVLIGAAVLGVAVLVWRRWKGPDKAPASPTPMPAPPALTADQLVRALVQQQLATAQRTPFVQPAPPTLAHPEVGAVPPTGNFGQPPQGGVTAPSAAPAPQPAPSAPVDPNYTPVD